MKKVIEMINRERERWEYVEDGKRRIGSEGDR